MPSPGCHQLFLPSADLKIRSRSRQARREPAVSVGVGETSDKTCCHALMQRDPSAVPEVAW